MLPEPYLGPTPEDYGDPGWSDCSVPEHPDDDLPMTLPTFKLLPDYPHLEPSDASGSGLRVVGSGVARAPSEWALRFPASLRGPSAVQHRPNRVVPSNAGPASSPGDILLRHCLKRTGATALAQDESFTDEYRLDMGGWKSRDSMAAYAHHGAAKRGNASAMMSAKVSLAPPAAKEVADVWAPTATSPVPAVAAPAAAPATPAAPCVASSQYAVGVVASPPLSQQVSAAPPISASVPAAQAPPPSSPGVQSFAAMWPGNCGQFAGQLSMMSQQMSAFQLQMQMSSIQLQMQSMQKLMESSKESSKE
ncbi:hypothetical protein V8C86DRAFT_3133329 [Haematococcus lacustris]